ncbi:alpha/beta hydrolase [Actinomadura gamaensis]|uniref:Alpha/beta hydrolase n=1 Tax=Actinomadura gamaensis TaxID=1763541 RepID=A0ABV9UA18_9ACTN
MPQSSETPQFSSEQSAGETPAERPHRRRHPLRRLAACAVLASGVLFTTAGTGHADPYAKPGPVPMLSPTTLTARYAAERVTIEKALKTAKDVGDTDRARALTAFLRPDRHFLSVDPRGRGQAVEVVGDLAHARRVAVLVPGADSTIAGFDTRAGRPWASPGGGARAVYDEARRLAPASDLAVVAWLGYAAPKTFSSDVLTDTRAERGAVELRRFLVGMHRANPSAEVGLLCHSYGSVVCGRAAMEGYGPGGPAWQKVSDIALFGSPGTTAWTAGGLGTTARVWAGRGATDWMEDVPHVRIFGLGLGPDPVSRSFGARVFQAGRSGHSDYLAPGSPSLRNLTYIALGRPANVTRA